MCIFLNYEDEKHRYENTKELKNYHHRICRFQYQMKDNDKQDHDNLNDVLIIQINI